ncbi:MAG TPA: zinc-binding dehydrogenase [Polyangiaceae bacterium]|nr:zinc-binding dehydrogenase [Polyangiaceae bacterium]
MAALPQQGLTAYGMVHHLARVRAGQTVLLHAAAGGVGQIAIQLLRKAGARVLGTVSTEEKAAIVRGLGGEPLLYGDDLATRVRRLTAGRGVDVVFDSVGRATQHASLEITGAVWAACVSRRCQRAARSHPSQFTLPPHGERWRLHAAVQRRTRTLGRGTPRAGGECVVG